MKKIISHPAAVISIVSAVALIVGVFSYAMLTRSPSYHFITVGRRDLSEEVSASGQVAAVTEVDLGFEIGGTVASVPASVGAHVAAGAPLAELSQDDALVGLASAQAALESAQAAAAVSGTQASSAAADLAVAETSLANQIASAYAVADDAIHNHVDVLFNNPESDNPQINIPVNDFQLMTDINASRAAIETMLDSWRGALASTSATDALGHLDTINSFLNNVAIAANGLPAGSAADADKAVVSLARTNVSLAESALSGAEAAVVAKQSAYRIALEQSAGTASGTPSVSQAAVSAAEANLAKAQVALGKTVLRAPFAGTVTAVDAKIGETVSPGETAVSMISDERYEVDLYVSEIDVAKLAVGDTATVTLDAYGAGTAFLASVVSIDPAETTVNGAPAYKTVLEFAAADPRIKPGMTANADIAAASSSQALAVPAAALIRRDDGEYVMQEGPAGPPALAKVTTGITGSDGYVEILSGLSAGDRIVGF